MRGFKKDLSNAPLQEKYDFAIKVLQAMNQRKANPPNEWEQAEAFCDLSNVAYCCLKCLGEDTVMKNKRRKIENESS